MQTAARLVAVALLVLVTVLSDPARAACKSSSVPFCDGCTNDIYVTVSGAEECRLVPNFGGGAVDLTILERAKAGRITKSSNQMIYLPRQGYKSSDTFLVLIRYRSVRS